MNIPQDLYLTEIDLYRFGNATSPRLDHVRVPRDIPTTPINGVAFVQPGQHGISLMTKERAEKTPGTGWVWLIAQGTHLEPGLKIVKDSDTHYFLAPSVLMPLDEFKGQLARLAARCKRVWRQNPVAT
ncbi:MAG: hypothetical protein QM790_00850 [Nibricoccus sp.]